MWSFLVDEDMPRSTARVLCQLGFLAEDVRDVGLRGHSDPEVFDYAQVHGRTLITADKGFANVLAFPLGSHSGIIILRLPNELSTDTVNEELRRALADLAGEDLRGLLVIVESGRTRIRRPSRYAM